MAYRTKWINPHRFGDNWTWEIVVEDDEGIRPSYREACVWNQPDPPTATQRAARRLAILKQLDWEWNQRGKLALKAKLEEKIETLMKAREDAMEAGDTILVNRLTNRINDLTALIPTIPEPEAITP